MWHVVKLLIGLWLVGVLAGIAGCAPTPGGSLSSTGDLIPLATQTGEIIRQKVEGEGILDKFVADIRADHLVEPGIISETAIIVRSSLYLKGTSGAVTLSASGHGTQMSESTRTALEQELSNPKLTIEEKKQIVDFLVGLENPPAATAEKIIPVSPGG